MLDKPTIEGAFERLNAALAAQDLKGEVCLYGGAVMCLVYEARPSTKDVDAIFHPAREVREMAARVGADMGIGEQWLNDGVKGFLVEHPRQVFQSLSHLTVSVPEPDYLLAMKVLAARADTADAEDVRFLIRRLGLKKPEDVFALLAHYYPDGRIRPAARFFVEEIFNP